MKQTLKYILDQINILLKFSESKHSIALTLASGVVVFAVTFINQYEFIVTFLSASSIVFCLISILYSFVGLSARRVKIKKKFHKPKTINLMYYRNIMYFDEKSYISEIKKEYKLPKEYIPDEFDYDLARQIISNSKVINKKFSYFNFAIMFLFVAITFLVVAICIVGAGNAR